MPETSRISLDHQKTRGASLGKRITGDKIRWKIVIEFVGSHPPKQLFFLKKLSYGEPERVKFYKSRSVRLVVN